jgi:hypothetical protein
LKGSEIATRSHVIAGPRMARDPAIHHLLKKDGCPA